MKTVIVSTHFDDAVLSCWGVIDGDDDVGVLTVFTEGPEPGPVMEWDADTGVDSHTRMLQRVEENRAALAVAGRTPTDLGLREGIYGGGAVKPELLRPYLAEADTVLVPAGVGAPRVHPEHVLVRDACLTIRPDAQLYADQPYSLFRPDSELRDGLAAGRDRRVVSLTPAQRERKAEALRCYAGELGKLEAIFGPFVVPGRLEYEVFWDSR